jgi:hypothetical protein
MNIRGKNPSFARQKRGILIMKKLIICWLNLLIWCVFSAVAIFGQVATSLEIKPGENAYYVGSLSITVNGKTRKIADEAADAWLVHGGRDVVYAVNDRTRGFEAEGQSLKIYNVKTRKTRQIMAEYTFVTGLTEAKLSTGKSVFLVSMGDGGLGASYFAVVDPNRGQVLSLDSAELLEVKGDKVSIAFYENDDWEAINQKRDWSDAKSKNALAEPTKVKPAKIQSLDLREVLKNKVIYNKTNEELGREYERTYSDLTIYYWRPNDKGTDKEYFLMGYMKQFPRTISPLRLALATLFGPVSKADQQGGWESAVFGMKFEGVVLKNGVATIKFSQGSGKRAMPKFAGQMFLEAVEKTARQFPTVKKVEICEVGGTTFAFDLTPQIPKCAGD